MKLMKILGTYLMLLALSTGVAFAGAEEPDPEDTCDANCATVPEPGTMALMALGVAGLVVSRKHFSKK